MATTENDYFIQVNDPRQLEDNLLRLRALRAQYGRMIGQPGISNERVWAQIAELDDIIKRGDFKAEMLRAFAGESREPARHRPRERYQVRDDGRYPFVFRVHDTHRRSIAAQLRTAWAAGQAADFLESEHEQQQEKRRRGAKVSRMSAFVRWLRLWFAMR